MNHNDVLSRTVRSLHTQLTHAMNEPPWTGSHIGLRTLWSQVVV